MKELVKILNLIFCFLFGFFCSQFILTGLTEMWYLYICIGSLILAIFGFTAYGIILKKENK